MTEAQGGETALEETGPIDFLVVEFHDKELNGELLPPLLDLVDRRIIRILDALMIVKAADNSFASFTTDAVEEAGLLELGALAGASSGLLDDEDAAGVAAALEPGTTGLVLLYENLWAVPFAVAARKAGGQVVADGRIPVQAVVASLDALDAADA